MVDQNNFFLTDTSGVRRVDAIQVYHPDFGNKFYQSEWINEDIVATNEDGETVTYKYDLFNVERGNVVADLEQELQITFEDYNDELKDAIYSADHMQVIKLKYRQFRDDDFSSPLDFIQTLNVIEVSTDSTGSITFKASAEELNSIKTGIRYTLNEYPLLKGTI